MPDITLSEAKTISLGKKLRAKAWMARWSILLWLTFATSISIVSWLLFPGAHFWVDGGIQGLKLVASVDVILGPVLFMLVANPAKSAKARRIDTVTLITIQLLAMSWGGWQVYTQRPVAISYMPEGFALPLIMDDFTQQKATPDSLATSRLGGLPAFYVSLPTGKDALHDLSRLLHRNNAPIAAQTVLLKPLLSHEQQVFSKTKRIQGYWSGEGAAAWEAWTSRHGGKPAQDYHFIVFMGRYGNAVLIIDEHKQLAGHIQLPGDKLPAALS